MEEKLRKIYELSAQALTDFDKHKRKNQRRRNLMKVERNFELGLFQGSKSKAFSIAKKLINLGVSVEEVSKITELTPFEIKNFIDYT